ncbi:hypothetical protein, partial [Pseudoalteromonas sp. S1731]|uniref:hypothetical protein n=1 Tax=Pseudoalteromonas sp. S1731 TaxID=579515 RepID=UPI001BB0E327
ALSMWLSISDLSCLISSSKNAIVTFIGWQTRAETLLNSLASNRLASRCRLLSSASKRRIRALSSLTSNASGCQ